MVNVTLDTISDSSLTFIRDVLRKNLTDKQNPARQGSEWIFKSRPEEREINPPIVIVSQDTARIEKLTIGNKVGIPKLVFDIRVWARSIAHRDDIGDEILKVLRSPDSSDGTTKIKENKLVFKSFEMSEEDAIIDGFPKVMRIKRITVEFAYIGG